MAYSRIPLALANDGLLPAALGRTDARGTPRNAVLVAAVCYSVFVMLPFGQLVVADVLLYTVAMLLEFAALIQLRQREPNLRGYFRVPVGTAGITAIAAFPALVLGVVLWLSMRDGELAMKSLVGSGVALALGPLFYKIANRGPRPA
jgi:amino acid transporter